MKSKHEHVHCPESPKSHIAKLKVKWSRNVRVESMRRVREYAETPPADMQHRGVQGTWRILRNGDSGDTLVSSAPPSSGGSFSAVLPGRKPYNITLREANTAEIANLMFIQSFFLASVSCSLF